jgi:hypothetical protein
MVSKGALHYRDAVEILPSFQAEDGLIVKTCIV